MSKLEGMFCPVSDIAGRGGGGAGGGGGLSHYHSLGSLKTKPEAELYHTLPRPSPVQKSAITDKTVVTVGCIAGC